LRPEHSYRNIHEGLRASALLPQRFLTGRNAEINLEAAAALSLTTKNKKMRGTP